MVSVPYTVALLRFRIVLGFFIFGLLVSGITAFPLLHELKLLTNWLGLSGEMSAQGHTGLSYWILTVRFGLEDMYGSYPWIAYGTDWLAFGHIMIALFFVNPWVKPHESRANLTAGMVACILVIPLALICGPIRGVPFYWQLIDCSFGVVGIIPLLYCRSLLKFLIPPPVDSAV